jgi:hypothetical protein
VQYLLWNATVACLELPQGFKEDYYFILFHLRNDHVSTF